MTMTKVELLRKMDEYARLKFEDEEVFEHWLAEGVPDESDEEDLIELADVYDTWNGIVKCFDECVKMSGRR